jgi:hypothetical protein
MLIMGSQVSQRAYSSTCYRRMEQRKGLYCKHLLVSRINVVIYQKC